MKFNKLYLIAVLATFLFSSCSNDDDFIEPVNPTPEGAYDNGFLVLNEGANAPGTVTYVSDDLQTVNQTIFQAENGQDIGNFAQSIFFNDDLAYIISNGSNIISVVNRYTFELVGVVDSGLEIPRYGVIENGKAYVTNQAAFEAAGADSYDDFLAIINLTTLEVENTVPINAPAEFIKEEGNKLYIQNATYGTGNHISVFNPATEEMENENKIETNTGLNSFEIEDGNIYALSANKFEEIDIDTKEVTNSVNLTYVDNSGDEPVNLSASNLQIDDDAVYYTVGKSVYTMTLEEDIAPTEPLLSYESDSADSAFGVMYGFAVNDFRIYIADGGDFASDSFIEVYDLNGDKLEKIDVGVGPNGFYFND